MKTVAIVGRPNVGKSALFNRLTRKEISIVFDRPGVTRDRIVAPCRLSGHEVELIDTGGLGLEDSDDFGAAIAHEAEIAFSTAEEILFVVDGREGVTPLDEEVARRLRRTKHRVVLVVNKVDQPQLEHLADEFTKLGFREMYAVSASHGVGMSQLIAGLTAPWDAEQDEKSGEAEEAVTPEGKPLRLAIVGRPNVGKSSLINALLKSERSIVSPIAGTTRDNVDVPFEYGGNRYLLIDTAGMRQERRIKDALEQRMSGRSAHAMNRAELCVLVLDVIEGPGLQEKKIGGLIAKAERPCVIVANKWDIAKEQGDTSKKTRDAFLEIVRKQLYFLDYAPVLFASAKTGEHVHDLMKLVERVEANRRRKVPTSDLNEVLHNAQQRVMSPSMGNRRLKIYYATQQLDPERPHSAPTFQVFINSKSLLTPSYQRYLEIQMRNAFPLEGCPIRWFWREKEQRSEERTPAKRSSARRASGAARKR